MVNNALLRDVHGFATVKLANLAFYLGMAFLLTHELDAMTQSEWKLLYVLRSMPGEVARDWFVWLHVPLFGLLIWVTHHHSIRVALVWRRLLAVFLPVHAVLHYRLAAHPLYTFDSTLSQTLIYGGALCGIVYLVLSFNKLHNVASGA